MEFPFGHHHHHHHADEEEEHDSHRHRNNPAGIYPPPGVRHVSHDRSYDPPPPPFPAAGPHHDRPYDPPPPPFPTAGSHHDRFYDPPPPPFPAVGSHHDRPYDPPPPPFPTAGSHHVSHQPGPGYAYPPPGGSAHHVSHQPGVAHVSHESWDGGALNQLPTVRIFSKAQEDYSLSIRDGKVILELKNPNDKRQHWIKDLKYSTKVKDKEGYPAFALVNKATGEAVKHSLGATKPVSLIPYNPNVPDVSVLWTESKDLGDGFRCIRMVNNILLNFDAFNGDENHGGVHDGTYIVLWEWLKGKNQRWKIVPY